MKIFKQLREASITTMTDFDEYPIEKQAKEFRLKLKKMPGKGNAMMGPDKMTLTGSEKDLIKYFVKYMGADKKDKLKDLQKEFGESVKEMRQIVGMQSAHVVEPITDSTAEYARSLRKIALDKQLKKISKKDKELLTKIADMLAKEKK
jgi:hypothetical protein